MTFESCARKMQTFICLITCISRFDAFKQASVIIIVNMAIKAKPSTPAINNPATAPLSIVSHPQDLTSFVTTSQDAQIKIEVTKGRLNRTYTTRAISSNMKSKSATVHSLATNLLLQF